MNKSSKDFATMLRKAVEATVVKRPVIRKRPKPVKDAIYGVEEPKKKTQRKVLPKKNLTDAELQRIWTKNQAEMKSQTANILSVSWNVGAEVSSGGFNRPYNTHQVVITSDQIESLMSSISSWLDTTCMSSESKTEELANFRNYITNGADASSQLVMCNQYRIVIMGIPSAMSSNDRKALVIHEMYYAFQQDLSNDTCSTKRDSSTNGTWFVEGGAEYFTQIEINGSSTGVSKMLQGALEAYETDNNTSIAGNSISSRGAAGILLMIERGWLT